MTSFALPVSAIFTTPVALASVATTPMKEKTAVDIAMEVISGDFISTAVFNTFLPLCWDVGKVLFAIGCIQGVYMLIRSDTKGFINKTKWATIGYIALRFIQVFITFIDTLAVGICANMGIK